MTFSPLLSSATPLHRCHSSLLRWHLLHAISGGDPALVSQWHNLCQALASMGQTISFSLTLGSTIYFNLDTNIFHLNPLSNSVSCDSEVMNIVKKTTDSASCESTEVPLKETTRGSVQNETSDIPIVSKDDLPAETKCEQCVLIPKVIVDWEPIKENPIWFHNWMCSWNKEQGSQAYEICNFCKDIIKSPEKHNISGLCSKNKSAQAQALYAFYWHHTNGPGSGFPVWMVNQSIIQF